MNKQQQTTEKALYLKEKAKTMDELAEWFGMTKMTLYKRFREEDWTKGDTALINIEFEKQKKKSNHIKIDVQLPWPTDQMQEALYELIHSKEISREYMMIEYGIRNITAIISKLRNKFGNKSIISNEYISLNKFGREISYVNYEISDREKAIENYMILVSKN